MKKLILFSLVLAAAIIGSFFDAHAANVAHAATAGFLFFGKPTKRTMADAEKEARAFLANNGHDNGYRQFNGQGNQLLSFTGNSAEYTEAIRRGNSFNITITSTHTATQNVILSPGIDYNAASPANGVLTDGAVQGLTGVTASASPGTIKKFIQEFRHTPVRLLGFKITSDVAAQTKQIMTVKQETSTRDLGSESINLSTFNPGNQFRDKELDVDLAAAGYNIQLDYRTILTMPIVAASTTTFTLFLGSSVDIAAALQSKPFVMQNQLVQTQQPQLLSFLGHKNRY